MRISRIVAVLSTLFVLVTVGAFSGLNALACGPSSPCCANHTNHGGGGGTPQSGQAVNYTCPMHPEVLSEKPGKCPKCDMFLVVKAEEKTVYTCPMHPEVKVDAPGKCPKCGMKLEKKSEKASYQYFCPMDADVISNRPGNCPKCGMFLEARPAVAVAPPPAPPKTHAAPTAGSQGGHAH